MNPQPQIDQATNRPASGPARLEPVPLGPLPARPLVSILMANYNYGAYIGEAIESVLGQTYDHWELLVADDGSTDDSCAVVERYAQRDPRIRLLRSPQNRGQADGFNRAYAASRGAIICLLDSDDMMASTKLERVVARFREEPHVGVVNHRITMVDHAGRHVLELPYVMQFEHGWIADRVIRRGGRWLSMPGCAIAFRREIAEVAFPIPDAEEVGSADGYLIGLLPLLGAISGIDEALYHYRIHGGNDTGDLVPTAARLAKYRRFTELSTACVNQRLVALGLPERQIDYRRNVVYWQTVLEWHLLQPGWSRDLLGAYVSTASLLLRDDLYGRVLGAARAVNYGITVLLPAPVRRHWLALTLGSNPAKRHLRTAVSTVRAWVVRAAGAVRGGPAAAVASAASRWR